MRMAGSGLLRTIMNVICFPFDVLSVVKFDYKWKSCTESLSQWKQECASTLLELDSMIDIFELEMGLVEPKELLFKGRRLLITAPLINGSNGQTFQAILLSDMLLICKETLDSSQKQLPRIPIITQLMGKVFSVANVINLEKSSQFKFKDDWKAGFEIVDGKSTHNFISDSLENNKKWADLFNSFCND